jgi:phytoene synthase
MRVTLAALELDAAGITDPALRSSYRLCRRINARHGRTYYLATLLLPPAKRRYVHALYGFARYADDIVDAQSGDRRRRERRFVAWSEEFLADVERGDSADPVRLAVIDTVRRWDIPISHFRDFLDSMRMDLSVTEYDTYEELTRYTWGSAAVIGLEMLPILGRADEAIPWEALRPHAVDLGIAFQLTNFIRDVGEDLRLGRIYLPQESLRACGVDRERLEHAARTGRVDGPIRALLAGEVERARTLYASAAPGIDLVHPTSRNCLRTASALYGGILAEIERAEYDVFVDRISVPVRRRLCIAGPAAISAWWIRTAHPKTAGRAHVVRARPRSTG